MLDFCLMIIIFTISLLHLFIWFVNLFSLYLNTQSPALNENDKKNSNRHALTVHRDEWKKRRQDIPYWITLFLQNVEIFRIRSSFLFDVFRVMRQRWRWRRLMNRLMKIRSIAQKRKIYALQLRKKEWKEETCEREREKQWREDCSFDTTAIENTNKNAPNQLIEKTMCCNYSLIILKLSIDACESHALLAITAMWNVKYITFADSIMCVYDVINTPITLQTEWFCWDFCFRFSFF